MHTEPKAEKILGDLKKSLNMIAFHVAALEAAAPAFMRSPVDWLKKARRVFEEHPSEARTSRGG